MLGLTRGLTRPFVSGPNVWLVATRATSSRDRRSSDGTSAYGGFSGGSDIPEQVMSCNEWRRLA